MSAICNYSHPELQISQGLVRHHSGSLFPYNPEFYENTTGLYGPGSIYCWYLLLASNILNWGFTPKDERGCRRPEISNDFLAVIAYPVFAATDMTVQAMRLLGTEYRALAIFCLRFPKTELDGFAKFNKTQLDLRDIPPDILSLGQHVIDITGPMTICYTFAPICFASILWSNNPTDTAKFRPTRWTRRLIYIAYSYTMLSLVTFHLSLGNLGISLFVWLYEAIVPFEFAFTFGVTIMVFITFLGTLVELVAALIKRSKAEVLESLKSLASALFGTALVSLLILMTYVNGLRLVPDLGVTVGERDQLATLIVGVVTICFTLYDISRSWNAAEGTEVSADGGDTHEMEALNSQV
ncbi:hypothetical protein AK830_g3634 [Neonectria ditissima]|uniref:Uncharacterized protein n=1 Tax=Neonectria ditissima TaxID=78410 RepID=A0A0P7AY13_9HYPO|nr:hypothetical protein AK830_g3634 [Neonectria ditissima]